MHKKICQCFYRKGYFINVMFYIHSFKLQMEFVQIHNNVIKDLRYSLRLDSLSLNHTITPVCMGDAAESS